MRINGRIQKLEVEVEAEESVALPNPVLPTDEQILRVFNTLRRAWGDGGGYTLADLPELRQAWSTLGQRVKGIWGD